MNNWLTFLYGRPLEGGQSGPRNNSIVDLFIYPIKLRANAYKDQKMNWD